MRTIINFLVRSLLMLFGMTIDLCCIVISALQRVHRPATTEPIIDQEERYRYLSLKNFLFGDISIQDAREFLQDRDTRASISFLLNALLDAGIIRLESIHRTANTTWEYGMDLGRIVMEPSERLRYGMPGRIETVKQYMMRRHNVHIPDNAPSFVRLGGYVWNKPIRHEDFFPINLIRVRLLKRTDEFVGLWLTRYVPPRDDDSDDQEVQLRRMPPQLPRRRNTAFFNNNEASLHNRTKKEEWSPATYPNNTPTKGGFGAHLSRFPRYNPKNRQTSEQSENGFSTATTSWTFNQPTVPIIEEEHEPAPSTSAVPLDSWGFPDKGWEPLKEEQSWEQVKEEILKSPPKPRLDVLSAVTNKTESERLEDLLPKEIDIFLSGPVHFLPEPECSRAYEEAKKADKEFDEYLIRSASVEPELVAIFPPDASPNRLRQEVGEQGWELFKDKWNNLRRNIDAINEAIRPNPAIRKQLPKVPVLGGMIVPLHDNIEVGIRPSFIEHGPKKGTMSQAAQTHDIDHAKRIMAKDETYDGLKGRLADMWEERRVLYVDLANAKILIQREESENKLLRDRVKELQYMVKEHITDMIDANRTLDDLRIQLVEAKQK
jgi:hypothetical protein